ncbi:hypothetical protein Enr13x_67470 [Stieleria neptunia]|uniref:Uncharacterized protein n=1 Tax=Stieleria neptunia TaxID=2527979 RepID=A0A518I183_9BACT|nr:hypothetical protein Enr13x_67470 [Stieleria neptunia]
MKSDGRPMGHDPTTANQLPQKNARRRKRRSGRCRQAWVTSVNGGGHRVGAIDLNSKTNSTRRLRCTTWFTRSAMATARAIAAVCQCTQSESPWEIERPNLRSAFQAPVCLGSYSYSASRYSYSYSNRQASVCLGRPRIYRTVTSNANLRKWRSDDIRWAEFSHNVQQRGRPASVCLPSSRVRVGVPADA